jgi:hypothetical protein
VKKVSPVFVMSDHGVPGAVAAGSGRPSVLARSTIASVIPPPVGALFDGSDTVLCGLGTDSDMFGDLFHGGSRRDRRFWECGWPGLNCPSLAIIDSAFACRGDPQIYSHEAWPRTVMERRRNHHVFDYDQHFGDDHPRVKRTTEPAH